MTFYDAVRALVDAGAEFVVIGGWSAIMHGSAAITQDLDLFFSRNRENILRVVQALAPFHPRLRDLPLDLPFIWDETTLRNGSIFTLSTDAGDIDLLAEVAGLDSFQKIYEKAIPMRAFGCEVRILDLESLVDSKKAAGRDKDLRALPELEALLEALRPEQKPKAD